MKPDREAEDALNQQLRKTLFQWRELHPDGRALVLLDCNRPVAPHDALHNSQLARREIKPTLTTVTRTDLSTEPEAHLQLLSLVEPDQHGYADEALFDLLVHNAHQRASSVNGSYVAGWICTLDTAKAVADHIARAGALFDLGQGRRRYLPLFEPHRLALLADDANAASFLTLWLKRASLWLFLDCFSHLRQLSSQPRNVAPAGVQAAQQHLGIGSLTSQGRVTLARHVVLALQDCGVVLVDHAEHRIDQALAKAEATGLRHSEDLIFFALNEFTLTANWSHHPAVRDLISKAVERDSTARLAAAMAGLPDDLLEQIARSDRLP